MKKKKDQWEEEAKDHFIADLKAQGRGDWIVSDSDVVVDKQTNRNFDYQLQAGTEFIALEIFRLVETREEIIRHKSWNTIANSIAAELRRRGVKGCTIHTRSELNSSRSKSFDVSKPEKRSFGISHGTQSQIRLQRNCAEEASKVVRSTPRILSMFLDSRFRASFQRLP